jgi:hypothetical protein
MPTYQATRVSISSPDTKTISLKLKDSYFKVGKVNCRVYRKKGHYVWNIDGIDYEMTK